MNRSSLRVISSGNLLSFTSFGAEERGTFGSGLASHRILRSERFFELDRRQMFYDCTNHDAKLYDFDGRIISNPKSAVQQISGEKAPFYVPLKMRRPSSPLRLAKIIVDSFTNLLFGEERFPMFRCEADVDTEDFGNTLAKVGELPTKMIRARNLGGSMGAVGMSWSWRDGKPRFDVHNIKNLFVHSWADRERLLPRHVSEIYLYSDTIWNGREFAKQWWWYRRDWSPNADIVFKPCPYEERQEPFWVPDLEKSYIHADGVTHFEWIQNLPHEDADGIPDYDGLYDVFEALDLLMSVVSRGATLNLDPTLVLKMDQEMVNRLGVKKGSDNALAVGKDGDANYLELAGEGIKVGLDLVNAKRKFALETAQCIVPDPSEVAAQGVSSVAIKAMFAPMIGKCNVLREQYGRAMKHMLEVMTEVARSNLKEPMLEIRRDPETDEPLVDEAGAHLYDEVKITLNLPPRVEKLEVPPPKPEPPKPPPPPPNPLLPPYHPDQPKPEEPDEEEEEDDTIDPEEDPEGAAEQAKEKADALKPKIRLVERQPGEGEEFDPKWGAYFQATPDDLSKVATAFQTATGGKAFTSAQTATEWLAQFMGVDPGEEWKRVDAAHQADKEHEKEMSNPPNIGGGVPHPHAMPPGAKPKGPPGAGGAPPFGGPPKGPPKPPGAE